jgi:DNA-binding CsgD family transcriptional regulator
MLAVRLRFSHSKAPQRCLCPSNASSLSLGADYIIAGGHLHDPLLKASLDRKLVVGFHRDRDAVNREGECFFTKRRLGPYVFSHFWGVSGDCVTLRIFRELGAPEFTLEDCATLNRILPHIRRSLSLSIQLGLSRGAGLLDGLSTVKCGAALIDARGQVHKANTLAQTILRSAGALRDGRLVLNDNKAQLRLDGQIADAIDVGQENDSDHGDFVVVKSPGGAHPLIIQVIPFRSREDVFRAVRAVLLLNDLGHEQGLRTDVLSAVLDLRPSEARVASLLAEGRSLDEIGVELGLKRETVRSYVKNILSKARVNKQSAFVAIASRMGNRLSNRASF